jgi:hypothetical protein
MKIFVKPSRQDLIVKDKFGRVIPSNGKSVCYDVFIKRLLNSGDLIKTNKPKTINKKQEENDANSRTK